MLSKIFTFKGNYFRNYAVVKKIILKKNNYNRKLKGK